MKNKLFYLGLILLAAPSFAMAVDGYKGVKFGSSFNELNAAKMCSWDKSNDDVKGRDSYYCDDFKFSGKKSRAMAFFINQKFERFAIVIEQDIGTFLESLKNKYGVPSSMVTPQELERFQSNGGSMNVKFDNDTVIVNFTHEVSSNKELTLLIYTSPKFDKLNKEINVKNLESDI